MIVLDTNVLSEMMKKDPDQCVLRWLDRLDEAQLFTTAVTVAELKYGIAAKPNGKKKEALESIYHELFNRWFKSKILPFNVAAADIYGAITAKRNQLGHPISIMDAQIASICIANGATLATRNTKDFGELDLDTINPWQKA